MAKNVMEKYPGGGIDGALGAFGDAWEWASSDQFSSFPDYATDRASPIVQKDVLASHFPTKKQFKREVYNYLCNLSEKYGQLGDLTLED